MSEHAIAVQNLLREGAVSYLDALYALHRFKRKVTDTASSVWNRRLPEFVNAVGSPGPVPNSVAPYCNPDGVASECDGNSAWIAARAWYPEPWNEYCYLGLTFERSETGDISVPAVRFMCGGRNRPIFARLKSAFRGLEHYYDDDHWKECGFGWKLEDPVKIEEEFEKMMDHAIKAWTDLGGWRQLPD